MMQMLRLSNLHSDASLKNAVARCLCHLCFSADAVRSLSADVLAALLKASEGQSEEAKLSQEAMARILVAEAEKTDVGPPRLAPELLRQAQRIQAPHFADMLVRLGGELIPPEFLAAQLLATAPVMDKAEDMAIGWLTLLLQLLEPKGGLADVLVSQGIATATTSLMDMHQTICVQSKGVAALAALAP